MKYPRHLLFILLNAVSVCSFCQTVDLQFGHIGTDAGLSQSNVTCILQDSRGFMWFGTQDGLNRYDGYRFTVYKNDPLDPGSLSNNFIKDIKEDAKGNIWVATLGGGLDRFSKEHDAFTHYRQDKEKAGTLSDDFVNCITEDSGGDLWVGTETGGLNRLDPNTGRFTSYIYKRDNPYSISDNDVTSVLEDSRHRIWVGTFHGGMNLLDKNSGQFTRLQHNDRDSSSLAYNTVTCILEDRGHRLWIGTRGGGLDLLNFPDTRFRHYKHDPHNSNSLARDVILSLTADKKNNIWIGTENGGLSIFNPVTGTCTNYLHDDIDNTSLTNNSIYSLYRDPHDNMWIGTFSGGVDLYNKNANQFALYNHNSSFNSPGNNNMLDFMEDSRGRIWIGTDGGGTELFDPATGKFTHFTHHPGDPNSICGNYVISVLEDGKKNIWMGTCGDGTSVYDPSKKTFRLVKKDPADKASISGDNTGSIAMDQDQDLWISSWGDGLNQYQSRKGNFIRYRHDSSNTNSISADKIIFLFADSKGYIWIGTFDKGLDLYDKKTKTFTHFVHDSSRNSLSDNNIQSIYEDHTGNIWICTKSGLNCLDRRSNHFTNFFVRDGLPDDMVFSTLEDDKGNLWIGTNNGLSRYNPSTRAFKNFSVADGLQSNEFKAHSCLKSASGAMYFGGVNGFNKFYPDSIKENPYAPPLVITSFQIFNKEVPVSGSLLQKDITETREITISYKESVISFGFASLNYTIPERKQYAYRLEGFDKNWNNIGTSHMATYTNLDPGKYIFEVKGLNNDGSWSSAIASVQLTVTPPFWKTWWFRLMGAIISAAAVIAFYLIRISGIQAQRKALEQRVIELDKAVAQGKFEIASDVLHDIGNATVGFGSYLTRIKRLQDQENPENLEKLAAFFESQQPVLATAIGTDKSGAVITMLNGIVQMRKTHREEISQSVTEQLNIINHIQEILHIQRQYISGKETRERRPVNIRNIINDCIAMLFSSFDKSAIAVSLDISPDLPDIKGDHTKLMQVFLQVLKNCLEAIRSDAQEKTICIRAFRETGQLILEIRDNGQGFDGSVAARLFERGFTTKPSGSGMGLYNCHDIMESHDGTIDIRSDGPGKGALTTIKFKLL